MRQRRICLLPAEVQKVELAKFPRIKGRDAISMESRKSSAQRAFLSNTDSVSTRSISRKRGSCMIASRV